MGALVHSDTLSCLWLLRGNEWYLMLPDCSVLFNTRVSTKLPTASLAEEQLGHEDPLESTASGSRALLSPKTSSRPIYRGRGSGERDRNVPGGKRTGDNVSKRPHHTLDMDCLI